MARPIIFSGDSLALNREGRKTNTRRVIKQVLGIGKVTEFQPSSTPGYDWIMRDRYGSWNDFTHADLLARCPYGQAGDTLYVKEALRNVDGKLVYDEDRTPVDLSNMPDNFLMTRDHVVSLFCPKWASRTKLLVDSVRVEQVQDITCADVISEGMPENLAQGFSERYWFQELWDSKNGKRKDCDWASNPFVWAVKYEVIN